MALEKEGVGVAHRGPRPAVWEGTIGTLPCGKAGGCSIVQMSALPAEGSWHECVRLHHLQHLRW